MKYDVWYMKPSFFRDGIMGVDWCRGRHKLPDPSNLYKTHVHLRQKVEADGLEHLYQMMQAERWSPNGEARELILGKGLQHTSMSMGDIAIDEEGQVFMVDRFGFTALNGKGDGLPDHGDWAMPRQH